MHIILVVLAVKSAYTRDFSPCTKEFKQGLLKLYIQLEYSCNKSLAFCTQIVVIL